MAKGKYKNKKQNKSSSGSSNQQQKIYSKDSYGNAVESYVNSQEAIFRSTNNTIDSKPIMDEVAGAQREAALDERFKPGGDGGSMSSLLWEEQNKSQNAIFERDEELKIHHPVAQKQEEEILKANKAKADALTITPSEPRIEDLPDGPRMSDSLFDKIASGQYAKEQDEYYKQRRSHNVYTDEDLEAIEKEVAENTRKQEEKQLNYELADEYVKSDKINKQRKKQGIYLNNSEADKEIGILHEKINNRTANAEEYKKYSILTNSRIGEDKTPKRPPNFIYEEGEKVTRENFEERRAAQGTSPLTRESIEQSRTAFDEKKQRETEFLSGSYDKKLDEINKRYAEAEDIGAELYGTRDINKIEKIQKEKVWSDPDNLKKAYSNRELADIYIKDMGRKGIDDFTWRGMNDSMSLMKADLSDDALSKIYTNASGVSFKGRTAKKWIENGKYEDFGTKWDNLTKEQKNRVMDDVQNKVDNLRTTLQDTEGNFTAKTLRQSAQKEALNGYDPTSKQFNNLFDKVDKKLRKQGLDSKADAIGAYRSYLKKNYTDATTSRVNDMAGFLKKQGLTAHEINDPAINNLAKQISKIGPDITDGIGKALKHKNLWKAGAVIGVGAAWIASEIWDE